jgi:RNA polymerase sigma factor (sigma-70 family)
VSNARVNERSDNELLREYAESRAEAAFAEIVRRHVDAVYSQALRMVRDPHLAHDVTQGTFIRLAQQSGQLIQRDVLSGWLHSVAHNLAANVIRGEVRRRNREQQAVTMNDLTHGGDAESEALWERIAPEIDAALHELSETDRDALTLRFFERKSAREMAVVLNVSEEAAQKRVTRALERLRELITQRGVTATVAGLAVALSTQAVQAAPIALMTALTTGSTLYVTSAATQTIVMTTLQKTAIAAALALSIGTGVHQYNRASATQRQIETLRHENAPIVQEVQHLRDENARINAFAANLKRENEQFQQQIAEVPRLRAEVARLRSSPAAAGKSSGLDPNDPGVQSFLASREQAQKIAQYFEMMPEKKIPELALLSDIDWLAAVKESSFDSEQNIRRALSHLRGLAKKRLPMSQALNAYLNEKANVLPADLSELKPHIEHALYPKTISAVELDQILSRYALTQSGNASDLPRGAWIIVEKAPVDKEYDSRAKFGNGTSTFIATGVNQAGEADYGK